MIMIPTTHSEEETVSSSYEENENENEDTICTN